MDLFRGAERLMRMDDRIWDRHANPWSGWSRIVAGPLLILALYSRAWIGWLSLPAIGAGLAWIWLNPRVFPPPRDYNSWAARGVLGERWFLARHRAPIPTHHRRVAWALTALSALGLPSLVYGLWVLDPGWTVAGAVLVILPKIWFVDRMVWLYRDMTGSEPGTPLTDPALPPLKESPA